MAIYSTYEEITESEANFIIQLYEHIKRLTLRGDKITLVRLGYELNIETSELSDYLFEIVKIVDHVENEIQQGKD